MGRCFVHILLLLSILGLTSCSSGNGLRHELANLGPLPLSGENPYVASNLLVSREVEANDTLKGFVEFRGVPNAIEIKKGYLKPYRFYFFYRDRDEAYLLEEASSEWIIRGPEAIPPNMLSKIERGSGRDANAPLLAKISPSRRKPSPAPVRQVEPQAIEEAPIAVAAKAPAEPKPKPPVVMRKKISPAPPPSYGNTTTEGGDVLHRVSYAGETLASITRWYTGDDANVEKIARINGLNDPNLLMIGQIIRIPRYLLKRSDPLPEQEVINNRRSYGFTGIPRNSHTR